MNFDFSKLPSRRVQLDSALDEIEQAQLVRQVSEVELAYFFKHALVQDTAYQSLLKNERRAFHLATARAIETSFPYALDENAALLAEHYHRAEEPEKTILYAIAAGERAAGLYAHPEARHFFSLALDMLEMRPPTPDNTRSKIDLTLKYLPVAWALGASGNDIQHLRDLAQRARALANAVEGTIEDRVRVMRVVAELGNALFARNEIPEAFECYREILAAAERGVYDAFSIANASINTAGVLTVQGYFERAQVLGQQGLEIGRAIPQHWFWYGGLIFTNFAGAARGKPHAALADLRAAIEHADATANLPAAAALSTAYATVNWMIRDWRAVLETGADAYERAARARDSIYQHLTLALCALACSELGDAERARNFMAQARMRLEETQRQLFFADWTMAMFAVTLYNLGELEAARAETAQLLAFAPAYGSIYSVGLGRRLRAQILAQQDSAQTQAMDDDMAAALALFEQGGARLEIAHTHAAWGKIFQARRNMRAANEQFSLALAQYRASGLDALATALQSFGI